MKNLIKILFLFCLSILTSCTLITYYYNFIDESKINLSSDVLDVGIPENIGTAVNTEDKELFPIISPDGRTLYFIRKEKRPFISLLPSYQHIWYAELDSNDNFLQARDIGKPLNGDNFPSGVISILPDGNSMFVACVYNNKGAIKNGFSMTYKQDDSTWSIPKEVVVENYYTNSLTYSANLASNGRILLLSLNRNEGYGELDLYVSFLQNNGDWSRPRNLGSNINTKRNEETPFLAADGVTLYFSSNGYPGYGSNDIFVCKRLDDSWQKWSKPINLGSKINTPDWDAYFTITAKGDYAYFVSTKEGGEGLEDIYRVKLPEKLRPDPVVLVYGKVINKITNQPIEAEIVYEKLSTGEIMGSARSNPETGEYKIVLPSNEKYSFRANAKGFISINENLDLVDLKEYFELDRDLYLVSPFEKGEKIRINNIFFNTAKSDLLPESYPELNRLVNLLNENPSITIKILGHTDNIGKKEDNLVLSKARAESVKNYIINQGINKNRITTEGFGSDRPISTNETQEGRALNRRVEFQIINY